MFKKLNKCQIFCLNLKPIKYTYKQSKSSLKFMASLCLVTIIALFQGVFGAYNIYTVCSFNENFTSNDPYETNLKELMSHFSHEIYPVGFALGSKGHGQSKIHGLAICNMDISAKDSLTCITNATKELRRKCPYGKVGLMCYDDCLSRY